MLAITDVVRITLHKYFCCLFVSAFYRRIIYCGFMEMNLLFSHIYCNFHLGIIRKHTYIHTLLVKLYDIHKKTNTTTYPTFIPPYPLDSLLHICSSWFAARVMLLLMILMLILLLKILNPTFLHHHHICWMTHERQKWNVKQLHVCTGRLVVECGLSVLLSSED